jgi:sugar phosphate isomerase/epimerase
VFDEFGLGVSAIASPIGKVEVDVEIELEIARLRRAISAAQVLGTRYVRIFSFYRAPGASPESIRDRVIENLIALAAEAARAGVVLIHENEKEIFGDTPARIVDIMASVRSEALRVAWDAANFVQVGVRPFDEGYALLRPYLEYVQVKDAVAGTGAVVPPGQGDGDIERTFAALRDDGYTGFVSLEPHLARAERLGGFSGADTFGEAARALASVLGRVGMVTT